MGGGDGGALPGPAGQPRALSGSEGLGYQQQPRCGQQAEYHLPEALLVAPLMSCCQLLDHDQQLAQIAEQLGFSAEAQSSNCC